MTSLHTFAQLIENDDRYELSIYERLLADDPCFVEAMFPLAELYTHLGEYEKGLAIDRRLAREYPDDSSVYYNLACSLSLCNKIDEAFDTLDRAVALGWDDIEHLQNDQDLDNLRSDPRFLRLISLLLTGK